jgi:hypothetical protein
MRYPARVLHQSQQEVRRVIRADSHVHRHFRDRVAAIVLLTLIVDVVCAVLAFFLERHAAGTEIHSFGTAIFWTTTQLLTVSSQMPNPLTTGGRVLDVFMELWAVSVVAVLAGAFGAFLVRKAQMADQAASASEPQT